MWSMLPQGCIDRKDLIRMRFTHGALVVAVEGESVA